MKLNIYKSVGINNIIKFLFILSIFLIPYDAFKVLPSLYRPISIFPIILIFILCIPAIFKSKFSRYIILFFCFYIISVFLGCFFSYINNSFYLFFDYFITITLALVVILSLYIVLSNSHFYDFKKWFAIKVSNAYKIPILISLLDALSLYGVLPIEISRYIHLIFGGAQDLRICGFTYEASWLSMHLLFAFFSYAYLIKNNIKKLSNKLYLLLDFVIFVLLFSMQGYIIALIVIFIGWLLSLNNGITLRKCIVPIIVIGVSVLFIVFTSNINSDLYFISRLKNLSLNHLLHNDASAYVRILNPTIGFLMGLEHPFGVGGGNYALFYGEYVTRYYPWGLSFYNGDNEIVWFIERMNGNAKCLYSKLFSETGIISILYFLFLFKANCYREDKFFGLWDICVLVMVLQFDSVFYLPLIFMTMVCYKIKSIAKEGENVGLNYNC